MALNVDAGNGPGLLNHDVSTGLDATVPVGGDFMIQQADVATALGALTGLCFADGRVGVGTIETGDLAGWFGRVEKPHQERLRCLDDRPTAEEGLQLPSFWWRFFRIGIFARCFQTSDRMSPHDSLACADLEVRTAGPALGGYHQSGLGLSFSAFRAAYLDAMARKFIGHGDENR